MFNCVGQDFFFALMGQIIIVNVKNKKLCRSKSLNPDYKDNRLNLSELSAVYYFDPGSTDFRNVILKILDVPSFDPPATVHGRFSPNLGVADWISHVF